MAPSSARSSFEHDLEKKPFISAATETQSSFQILWVRYRLRFILPSLLLMSIVAYMSNPFTALPDPIPQRTPAFMEDPTTDHHTIENPFDPPVSGPPSYDVNPFDGEGALQPAYDGPLPELPPVELHPVKEGDSKHHGTADLATAAPPADGKAALQPNIKALEAKIAELEAKLQMPVNAGNAKKQSAKWLIATMSPYHSSQRRAIIRSTWQRLFAESRQDYADLLFVISKPDGPWEAVIEMEKRIHGDVFIMPTPEGAAKGKNSLKTIQFFSALMQEKHHYKFVSKLNDEAYFDAGAFWTKYLQPRVDRKMTEGVVIGKAVSTKEPTSAQLSSRFLTLSWDTIVDMANTYHMQELQGEDEDLLFEQLLRLSEKKYDLEELSTTEIFEMNWYGTAKIDERKTAWAEGSINPDALSHPIAPGAITPLRIKTDDEYLLVADCFGEHGPRRPPHRSSEAPSEAEVKQSKADPADLGPAKSHLVEPTEEKVHPQKGQPGNAEHEKIDLEDGPPGKAQSGNGRPVKPPQTGQPHTDDRANPAKSGNDQVDPEIFRPGPTGSDEAHSENLSGGVLHPAGPGTQGGSPEEDAYWR